MGISPVGTVAHFYKPRRANKYGEIGPSYYIITFTRIEMDKEMYLGRYKR